MTRSWMTGRRAASLILIMLLAAIFVIFTSMPCRAEDGAGEGDSYTYRMKISAGNNGVMKLADGSEAAESIVYADESGSFPAVSTDSVRTTNSKYVVVGFKEAGHDEVMSEITAVSSVKSDLNYVAVYGVKGNMVPYTVRYLDRDNDNALMADATYYAPKGSSVMVSFKYVDGYAPTAYNLTKTITGDGSSDVLTFKYYESDLTVAQQTNAANAANPAAPAAVAANPAAAQAAAIDAATPGTPNVVNLDDEETPLASPEELAENEVPAAGINNGIIWAAIVAALLVALVIVALLIKRRRDSEEGYEQEAE
ncbi:MAG: hypothetical protein J5961_06075 [Mogibacterium sp.]|nr:hypothetical protein [Mogibacterium sp.]